MISLHITSDRLPLLSFIDTKKYNITYGDNAQIRTIYKNGVLSTISNFDVLIDSGYKQLRSDNIPVDKLIDMSVISKSCVLEMLVNFDVPVCPYVSFNCVSTNPITSIIDAAIILEAEYIVLKIPFGARGLGQVKIRTCDICFILQEVYKDMNDGNILDIIEKYPGMITIHDKAFTKKERISKLEELFNNLEKAVVTKFLPCIEEYRMLVFLDGTVILHDMKDDVIIGNHLLDLDAMDDSFNDIYQKLYNLLTVSNQLFLSADIYKTSDGELGMFEFSSEFGYRGYGDYDLIKNAVNKSLDLAIKSL